MEQFIISSKADIVEIADAVRSKTGLTGELTRGDIVNGIYSISVGIDTFDATATSSDIVNGKTAYVNGQKITGSHECPAGISLDTCTIKFLNDTRYTPNLLNGAFTIVRDGQLASHEYFNNSGQFVESVTFENVLCGSTFSFYIDPRDCTNYGLFCNGEYVWSGSDFYKHFFTLQAPLTPNAVAIYTAADENEQGA